MKVSRRIHLIVKKASRYGWPGKSLFSAFLHRAPRLAEMGLGSQLTAGFTRFSTYRDDLPRRLFVH